jgi:hypothetical protein
MPEPTGGGSREFLAYANQALAELEEATGKPVQIVEDPELNVLATIRRAGPGEASYVLRIKGGENRAANYLISGCSGIQIPSFRTAFPEPLHTS